MNGIATLAIDTLDHLSHSQIQTFTSCPRKWHYDKVEKAPRERVGSALLFGIAVHDALAAVNEAALHGEIIDAKLAFLKAWKAAFTEEVPIHYGKDTVDELLAKGQELVSIYKPPSGIVGVEQPFSVELDDLPRIEGRIDIIRKENDDLILVDLKTSGTRFLADTNAIEAQMAIYDLAYPAARHEAIVLGKLKTPTITVQNIVPWTISKLYRNISEVHHAMKSGVRYAVRGWQCESCPFSERCNK